MKYSLLTFSLLCAAMSVSATSLTPEQALSRAASLSGGQGSRAPLNLSSLSLAHTERTTTGDAALYVFNRPQGEGYMILSADDLAVPVLGYADSGEFSLEAMPETMKWWLEEYASQIKYMQENSKINTSAFKAAPQGRDVVEPMIKSRWDQTAPFNNLCPFYGTDRTYTGCVATSMAQIMNYWKYPEVGQGTVSYTANSIGKRLSMDFSMRPFDWDNILDDYSNGYSEEEADAVAYLMKACGYSVKMEFSTSASSSYGFRVPNALINYFNYDGNCEYRLRARYSPKEWEQMVYDNIKNVGPVLYNGTSLIAGGHSFVLDGYDGNGYYHINWGWSGISNGYFLLDALTPTAIGAGGGYGGYNFSQDAVFGIQPPTGQEVNEKVLAMSQGGSLEAEVKSGVMTFSLACEDSAVWLSYNDVTVTAAFGAIFEPINGTEGETVYASCADSEKVFKPGYGISPNDLDTSINLRDLNLPIGEYRVTFAANIKEDPDHEWIPVIPMYLYYNYVDLRITERRFTVTNHTKVDGIRIADGSVNNDLFFSGLADISLTVVNSSKDDMSRGFAPALFEIDSQGYPSLMFLGTSQFATVEANSTIELKWITSLNQMDQIYSFESDRQFYLTFFDESRYTFYIEDCFEPVIMHPLPARPSFRDVYTDVEGATVTMDDEHFGVQTITYNITEKDNIPVYMRFALARSGYFAYEVGAFVCELNGDQLDILMLGTVPAMMVGKKLEVCEFEKTLNVPQMVPDKNYILVFGYIYNNAIEIIPGTMSYIRLTESTGVETVVDDAEEMDANAMIYNLQGVAVGHNWDALPSGLYIRSGKTILKH